MKKKNLQILVGVCLLLSLISVFYTYTHGTLARLYDSKNATTNLTLVKGSAFLDNVENKNWQYAIPSSNPNYNGALVFDDNGTIKNVVIGDSFAKEIEVTYKGVNTSELLVSLENYNDFNSTKLPVLREMVDCKITLKMNDTEDTIYDTTSPTNKPISKTVTSNQKIVITYTVTIKTSSNVSLDPKTVMLPKVQVSVQNKLKQV